MRILGNILWLILGGFELALAWALLGVLWSITVIGIPAGMQCFKFASLALWPFGRTVEFAGGAVSTLMNVLWISLSGIWLAIVQAAMGLAFCITIIGIPFGLQYFKFAKLALMPFGAHIVTNA